VSIAELCFVRHQLLVGLPIQLHVWFAVEDRHIEIVACVMPWRNAFSPDGHEVFKRDGSHDGREVLNDELVH